MEQISIKKIGTVGKKSAKRRKQRKTKHYDKKFDAKLNLNHKTMEKIWCKK